MEYIVLLREGENLRIKILLDITFIEILMAENIILKLLESIAWFVSRKCL